MCRSRRELSNAYFLSTFGVDAAENEPSKVCPIEPSSRMRDRVPEEVRLDRERDERPEGRHDDDDGDGREGEADQRLGGGARFRATEV